MATTAKETFRYEMTADPKTGAAPQTLSGLIHNYRDNFLRKQIEIVPGLYYNQYEVIKRVYYYMHNQFESGPFDENGDPKYFYDLTTDRNDQATKNIDLDTKDCYIKAESEGAYLKSWLLRREFMAYAKQTTFGAKLNELSQDLPSFGTVVWKKCKDGDGNTDIDNVDLINIINDPSVKHLKDGLMVERHVLSQEDVLEYKAWDQTAVDSMLRTLRPTGNVGFMDTNAAITQSPFATRVDMTTPYYEIFELWGMIPRAMYEKYKNTGGLNRGSNLPSVASAAKPTEASSTGSTKIANDYVYVMAVVAGVDTGQKEHVLFCKKVDKELFPYKEVHYRRRKGRWMGVGNYELLFNLTEKANEITNRFFASLRISLLHLYQTRDKLHVKNVMTDLLDGDMVVSKSAIEAIPTEIRGLTEYRDEMARIEARADRMCSSLEVVTGENLPANTPFRLGSQQLASATKFFGFVQQNMGIFVENVFNEWLLPGFSASLDDEHILEILDDTDDMEIYYNAKRKLYQYEVMKRYVLTEGKMPDPEQLRVVGALVQDQIAKAPKQILVESRYYADTKYSVKMVITGENDTKKQNIETLSDVFQVLAANPAALQDDRLMKILNLILEETGFSPLQINTISQTQPNPSLNPSNQGGANASRMAPGAGEPTAVGFPQKAPGVTAAAGA